MFVLLLQVGQATIVPNHRLKAPDILSLDCRQKKTTAHHKYIKNIAMTDCLQGGYNIIRQSVFALFILYFMVSSVFLPPAVPAMYILGQEVSIICCLDLLSRPSTTVRIIL